MKRMSKAKRRHLIRRAEDMALQQAAEGVATHWTTAEAAAALDSFIVAMRIVGEAVRGVVREVRRAFVNGSALE